MLNKSQDIFDSLTDKMTWNNFPKSLKLFTTNNVPLPTIQPFVFPIDIILYVRSHIVHWNGNRMEQGAR